MGVDSKLKNGRGSEFSACQRQAIRSLVHILGIDLIEWRVLGVPAVGAVEPPLAIDGAVLSKRWTGPDEGGTDRGADHCMSCH